MVLIIAASLVFVLAVSRCEDHPTTPSDQCVTVWELRKKIAAMEPQTIQETITKQRIMEHAAKCDAHPGVRA